MPFYREASMLKPLRMELVAQCRARLPYEACGVLYGKAADGRIEAEGFSLVRNVAASPESAFRFDPDDWIRVWYDMQKNQRSLVGFFHSHPSGSRHPSRADGEGWIEAGSYWIVDPSDGAGRLYAYGRTANRDWYAIPLAESPSVNDG
ncbi:hypothetical protein J19TS2_19550 [Cohnella xylanilytica]|nr:hypothetical protein J19TS2_19550 [Cohnella xylanilytica]